MNACVSVPKPFWNLTLLRNSDDSDALNGLNVLDGSGALVGVDTLDALDSGGFDRDDPDPSD